MEVEILSQVKQQQQKKKKKISKWRCVVCNQMQSVCKVFAQGFVAKDLRSFIQSFNMSSAITEPPPLPLPQFQEEEEEEDIVHDAPVHNNKRRSDWSQFLDPVAVEEQQVEEESDFEPKIVTELPEDLFKKQKLNANADLYKPVFSNRNSTAKNVISPSNSLFSSFFFFFFFLVM
ncbi:MRN complex-interacting protein-like [Quercus lobata]|uniref:MRN complex-interacting protein-like n=1 Tax=Quercus lobata TaxID=97700 RepID=UPI0012485A58|nr:MRN complex-interacting protein-like [Quercus lobata]